MMKYFAILLCLFMLNFGREQESVPFNETGLYKAIEISRGLLVSLYDNFKLVNAEQCLRNLPKLEDTIVDFVELIKTKSKDPMKYFLDVTDFLLFFLLNKCEDLIKIAPELITEFKYIMANPMKYWMAVLANVVDEGLHFLTDFRGLKDEILHKEYFQFGVDLSAILCNIFF